MDHISPGGMSHSTSNNGFANASIPTPDLLSPMSVNSSDRFYSHGQASPMGGPRSSNPFLRQNSLDTYSNLGRDSSRSLQPLQLRDTLSRSRSESLQSPLRSSMSWKGNSLDHATYGDNISPTSRHQLYNPEQSQDSQGYGNNGYTIGCMCLLKFAIGANRYRLATNIIPSSSTKFNFRTNAAKISDVFVYFSACPGASKPISRFPFSAEYKYTFDSESSFHTSNCIIRSSIQLNNYRICIRTTECTHRFRSSADARIVGAMPNEPNAGH